MRIDESTDTAVAPESVNAQVGEAKALLAKGCTDSGDQVTVTTGPTEGTYLLTKNVTVEAPAFRWVGVTALSTPGAWTTVVFHGTNDGQGFTGRPTRGSPSWTDCSPWPARSSTRRGRTPAYPHDERPPTTTTSGRPPSPVAARSSRCVRVAYCCRPFMMSRIRSAVADGVLPTLTPAASRASCLAAAVPAEPDTMAPAWPMVLPSGAVKPAT